MPSTVVRMNPDGSLGPGWSSFAITPAMKPMMMVQRMPIVFSVDRGGRKLTSRRKPSFHGGRGLAGFLGQRPTPSVGILGRAWSQAGRQGTQTKPAPIEIGAGHLRDAETART